jgi:hypothetical protein
MSDSPVTLSIRLSTIKGFVKQPALVKSLKELTCSAEGCAIDVTENENGGFVVSLDCPKSMQAAEPWSVEPAPGKDHYIYRAVFEAESTDSMIESIERMLKMPDIKGSFSAS